MLEQVLVALVGLLGRCKAGKLPHREKLAAISGSVNAARVWRLARIAKILFRAPVLGEIGLGVDTAYRNSRNGGKASAALLVAVDAGGSANRLLRSFLEGRS